MIPTLPLTRMLTGGGGGAGGYFGPGGNGGNGCLMQPSCTASNGSTSFIFGSMSGKGQGGGGGAGSTSTTYCPPRGHSRCLNIV